MPEKQSWMCMTRHQNEPCVTAGHTIPTKASSADTQVGEIECMEVTPTSSCILRNPAWTEPMNHHSNISACGNTVDTCHYTRIAGWNTTYPKLFQNRSEKVQQTVFSRQHPTNSYPAHSLHQAAAAQGTVSAGRYSQAQKTLLAFQYHTLSQDPEGPQFQTAWILGKDPGQEQSALPASCYTLVIPHSPVWEMCSQEKYVISHYCLTTQPMILPKISNSGKSSHSSWSTFISWGANILLRDTATFTCLTSLCSFPQLRPHSSICGPFQTMRAHEEIPNDSYCTDCVQHTLNIQKVMLDQLYIAMALI